MSPKISVILANYNHAQYVDQALESIANQTYKDIEVIVVDDGSKDNSKDIIENWVLFNNKPDYKRIYLPENRGKWFALNTAISQASGKLVTLQDSDDYSCPERIERQLLCMERAGSYHNLCGFVHCYSQEEMDKHKNYKTGKVMNAGCFLEGYDYMPHQETTRWVLQGRKTPGINHYYLGNYEAHGATCLFYKQLWEHGMKFLPGNMGLRCQIAEDSDFNTKMTLLLQRTSIILEPLYLYRRNSRTNGAFLEDL